MAPPIEILVHVSGPSRAADDARYRREASGFLQFDIAERHTLLGQGPCTTSTLSRAEQATDESRIREWPEQLPPLGTPVFSRPPASTLPWTTTKQTPHLLIERTPALPRPRTAPTPSTPSQAPRLRRSQSDSWHTPPSEIPDSQPTRIYSGPQEVSSTPYLKRPFASSSPSPTGHASPPAKRPRLQVSSSPPSEDPPLETRPPATSPFSLPPSTKGAPSNLPSSSSPSKNPAAAVEAQHPAVAPSSSSSSANPPPSSPPPPNNPSPPQPQPQPHEIHPPRPKPSNNPFKTHLTYSLSQIARILPLAKFFNPVTSTRTPSTLERGHWLIPIGTWDERSKKEFWEYLIDFVGRGQAGWGTWCVREEVDVREELMREGDGSGGSDKENLRPVSPRQGDGEREREREREREVVRVYCWGEVVGEVWLALFIGSKRKIKGSGARWVDAGGVAVVCMR